VHPGTFRDPGSRVLGARGGNLIRTSLSEKYDFSTKITTHVNLPVTSQSCVAIFVENLIEHSCVAIFVENQIENPRNCISQKFSPRLNRSEEEAHVGLSLYVLPICGDLDLFRPDFDGFVLHTQRFKSRIVRQPWVGVGGLIDFCATQLWA